MLQLKQTVIRTAALFFTLACFSVQARPVMTITCDDANGTRTDFYAGEFEQKPDGFDDIKPKFVFDDKNPKAAIVTFEPVEIAKKMGFKAVNLFNIIVQSTDQITMVAADATNVARMYTLFPKKGIGYFTRHKYDTASGGDASTRTLISKCNVVKN
jgi:hypothetical protein